MLALQTIVGGTVAAGKEAFKTFAAPSTIVGQKATCALAKIDCSKISRCQDYENITFEGQATIKLTELTNPAQKTYLMDHLARFWDTYCTENPCHLPLQCAPSIQEHHYWYPNEINPSFNPDEAEMTNIWEAAYPKKCVPVEMVATSWQIYSVSTVRTPTGWDTLQSEISGRFDNGVYRWLITGKTLAKDVPRDKIFPLVYSFQPKTQKRGQLCRTDQDCAEGLTCRGETITYNNVYVYSGEGTPVSLMKSTTARPETVTYQRCY